MILDLAASGLAVSGVASKLQTAALKKRINTRQPDSCVPTRLEDQRRLWCDRKTEPVQCAALHSASQHRLRQMGRRLPRKQAVLGA